MSAAVSVPTREGKLTLRVLTNSELREARACMRRHKYKYRLRRRPRRDAEPLRFGTFWHVGQQNYWGTPGDVATRLQAAYDAFHAYVDKAREDGEPVNEYALVTAEELMLGYATRWAEDEYKTIAVEKEFEMPLVNPETGAASRTFRLGGKIDGVIACVLGKLHVLEHKTTGSDIELGSLYWEKVRSLDTQVSQYIAGAKAIGFDVEDCIYDVVRKPTIRPLKATPEDKRQYTQPKSKACPQCKKSVGPHIVDGITCIDGKLVTDPGGRLYANQRDHNETPEEWRKRLRADIAERPEFYFARGTLVRLEEEERDHAFDVWQAAKMLHEAERSGFAPKNPDACSTFGGCPYLPVCSGMANINDDRLFRTASESHEELQQEI